MTYFVHDRMLDLMEAEGMRTLFGIPDPSFIGLFNAAQSRGWRVIAPHHEQAGAFMADAHWRMTGLPSVVVGNQGPGVANLAAAAICAAKENVPTIFIGGQRERVFDQKVRKGQFQYTRQPKYFEEAMKYVGIIEFAEQVDEIFHEAFRRALSGTPGPVYIEYPMNVLESQLKQTPVARPEQYRLVHQGADAARIAEALALIEQAKSPILLVGQGVFVSRAHQVVADLAIALGCPVIQTPGAGAVLPGMEKQTFPYPTPSGISAVADADLVIAIGTEIGEPVHYGTGRHWAKGKTDRKWIYIERDPLAIGVNRQIDIPLVGDLRDVVPQLTLPVRVMGRKPSPKLAELESLAVKVRKLMVDNIPTTSQPVHPGRLVVEATRDLPADTVMIRDGGSFAIFSSAYSQLRAKDVIWCQNFGHLGTGLPHAIGAQLAVGDKRRVVLMSGDSAFLFHISELETAVRKQLPIICVVGCDYAWGLEVAVYRNAFGLDTTETEAHWGKQVRMDLIAKGFGAYGEFIERTEDIAPAVKRALESNLPSVIQVSIDAAANASEMPGIEEFMSWYGERGY
ncbi:thiamine pyrophosphate-binding protein [Pseudomonas yamanorum]|uniref:thiamine pyrophosphate-binding protein n=1 Tax=Pseudomonas yamanorum TaxID=515393 RepID=UPI0015A4E82F|nr:thiamine pyrophosphate-binding protein [Pseudomonas yamanorum]NWD25724.1 thiamine pyrophosphate-binding protein [Pseudomonas yamanorum]